MARHTPRHPAGAGCTVCDRARLHTRTWSYRRYGFKPRGWWKERLVGKDERTLRRLSKTELEERGLGPTPRYVDGDGKLYTTWEYYTMRALRKGYGSLTEMRRALKR